jgi:hypothetical protein
MKNIPTVSPKYDVATTMPHCEDGILVVMKGVGFAPDIAFSLMTKSSVFLATLP